MGKRLDCSIAVQEDMTNSSPTVETGLHSRNLLQCSHAPQTGRQFLRQPKTRGLPQMFGRARGRPIGGAMHKAGDSSEGETRPDIQPYTDLP
jgi:hypothetical protein